MIRSPAPGTTDNVQRIFSAPAMHAWIGAHAGYLLVALLAIFLCACESKEQHPLRLGTNTWTGYEPLYLARDLQLLKQEDVRLLEFVSATQVMRNFIDGNIDAAALTLDEALLLEQQGMDARIVLVMDYSAGADGIVARADIQQLSQLKGKRIGVETTALGAYMMHRILEIAELTPADVSIQSLDHSQHYSAFVSGRVDAVVTFDPVLRKLVREQKGTILLDTSQLSKEVIDVLVVRASAINDHQASLERTLKAWFDSLKYIRDNPVEAARHISRRHQLDLETSIHSYEGLKLPDKRENMNILLGEPAPIVKHTYRLGRILQQSNLLEQRSFSTGLFDEELLRKLYQ